TSSDCLPGRLDIFIAPHNRLDLMWPESCPGKSLEPTRNKKFAESAAGLVSSLMFGPGAASESQVLTLSPTAPFQLDSRSDQTSVRDVGDVNLPAPYSFDLTRVAADKFPP
ncbi:unnamed protein product, partial [Amoebophrya sp. A25]